MKPSELHPLMKSMNFHPSRNMGQNFLTDDHILESIVTISGVKETDHVLEIGPGFGALTQFLIKIGVKLTAIEFDYRLAEFIREMYKNNQNFQLIEGDAVRIDYDTILNRENFHLVANLPYSASTPLLMTLAQMENPPLSMTIMLQKEVAERICAAPSCKAYGALSVCLQLLYHTHYERTVPPEVFHPIPEVDSALITLKRKDVLPDLTTRKMMFRLVKTAFSQRRKVMAKLLGFYMDRTLVEEALEALNIRKDARAEMLSADEFFQLGLRLPKPEQPSAKKSKKDRLLKRGKFSIENQQKREKKEEEEDFESSGDIFF